MNYQEFPLPFRAVPREELEINGQRVIEDKNGEEVAYVGFNEDAEFIALACNAHAGLVEALKKIRAMTPEQAAKEQAQSVAEYALAKAGVK